MWGLIARAVTMVGVGFAAGCGAIANKSSAPQIPRHYAGIFPPQSCRLFSFHWLSHQLQSVTHWRFGLFRRKT